MAVIDSVTDYSQTQRVVLLIDLNPLLHLKDPNPYLTSLLSTAKIILSFPPLSSSLFSFKPFFSSLSPLLSSSKLSIPSLSLSFNHPHSTLESLSQILTSLVSSIDRNSISSLSPRALHLAASMRQLVHEYAWDSVICDSLASTLSNCDSFVKSNLVILFSPVIRSCKCLSDFFGVEPNDECLRNVGGLVKKFRYFFESVNDAFVSRNIHFSWVDMKYETKCGTDRANFVHPELGFGFLESGIRDLGWGFSSSESIILGSALIPFGLIYPRIGIWRRSVNLDDIYKSINAQLSLEILDVSGKPLECKCCDLQLVNLNMLSGNTSKFMDPKFSSFEQKKMIWGDFSNGVIELHVKAVQKHDKCVKFEGKLADPILVCEHSVFPEKGQMENCSEYFEDRVLEILSMEMGEMVPRKSVPIWKILLSFLFREGYLAVVSLAHSSGNSLTGILKPFTVSSALLSIVSDQFHTSSIINEFNGVNLGQFVLKTDTENGKSKFDLSHSFGLVGSQSRPSPSDKCADVGHGLRKKNKRSLNMLQELTWSAFCEAALENFHIDLEDIYFARGCYKSKKLKFLKCWMKQIKKSGNRSLSAPERFKQHQDIPKETDNRLTKLPQQCEQPIASCSSVGEDSLTGASRIQDEVALGFCSETMESFFNNLPHKIQQGLESEEVDLESLAHRLVNSSIYWLYQKNEKEPVSEGQNHVVKHDTSIIAVELTKLLLRDPKGLPIMCISGDASSQASNLCATDVTSENIVRKYELQVLFRMEILQSEVGASFGESTKQKFVKQICLLLENIQCHLQGGFFGDWSLDKYVGKIIRSRYCQSLEDVVQRIYERMDLLLFEDEDESPNPLLNSEDSNPSWREIHKRDETDENFRNNNSVSAEGESSRPVETEQQNPGVNQEHARKIIEAQKRRQRARRFASFTSWIPDLQRVWAPKQQKAVKVKSDPLWKLSKRKEHNKISYDSVCETPMTGNKRSCMEGGSSEKDRQDKGQALCGSVSKALFQDD